MDITQKLRLQSLWKDFQSILAYPPFTVTWPINNSTSSELYLCKNEEYIVVYRVER